MAQSSPSVTSPVGEETSLVHTDYPYSPVLIMEKDHPSNYAFTIDGPDVRKHVSELFSPQPIPRPVSTFDDDVDGNLSSPVGTGAHMRQNNLIPTDLEERILFLQGLCTQVRQQSNQQHAQHHPVSIENLSNVVHSNHCEKEDHVANGENKKTCTTSMEQLSVSTTKRDSMSETDLRSKRGPVLSLDALLKQKLVIADLNNEVPMLRIPLSPVLKSGTRVTTVRGVLQASAGWIRRATQRIGSDLPESGSRSRENHSGKGSSDQASIAALKEDLAVAKQLNDRMRTENVKQDCQLHQYRNRAEDLELVRLRLIEYNVFLSEQLMRLLRGPHGSQTEERNNPRASRRLPADRS